jgi:predicted dehydrogenase
MIKYNVGLVGYGWVASAHIPAINASTQARVTGLHSSRPHDEKELEARHGHPIRTYPTYADMLADPDIHVISICSYAGLHAEQAIAAAHAGKHVILEKPIALNWIDCLRIAAAFEENGTKACVCFNGRFSGQFTTIKAVIDQGLIGDIHYAEVDYYHGIGPWYGQFEWNAKANGGGSALLTAGCHAVDAMLLCMGGDVASVTSMSTRSRSPIFDPYEYDTSSVTLVKFRDGRVAKCSAIVDCLQPYYFHTHLCGSEGSLLDNQFHSMKLHTDKSRWSNLAMTMIGSGDVHDHPFQRQFQAFFDALDRGQHMPLTDFATALHTHRIVFAADESARTGMPVAIT